MANELVHFHDSEADALPWLPTCILNDQIEAFTDSGEDDYHHRFFSKRRSVFNDGVEACGEDDRRFCSTERSYDYKHRHHLQLRSSRKLPTAAQPPLLPLPPHWKNYSKPDHKTKYPTNWAAGGPGMQAVFLVSGQRSGGTGVFLPRTAGNNAEKPKKPAFAPILLPSRVVQALNLNIHGLGLQVKPREHNNNVKGLERDRIRSKKSRDVSSQTCQNRSSSPEIFLPKEWTY
ncbi:hypothetical protein QVD17_17108 [Tagetes erecta]|uniref:Uncharacterized protein n=1 Tax=Tagetes erecta TaxID=13708 RepID=A0AAD8KXS4_TARER|nr:hypothetical protein QVD17_17108 [Tagetes erecta]